MSEAMIVAEGLGKRYRIGLRERAAQTFREALSGAISAPLRRLRTLGATGTDDDTFWALRDVSFEVRPGEVLGVIGRNGAGKSTLLKILSKITEPTEGSARLRGRVGSLLEVGTGFHPELTGRENIYLNGAILGMPREQIARRFDEIVAFAEMDKFLDTPVKRYSSGMYLRLAFAVAAHLDPEILIVDEVLAVGDASFQRKCLGRMREATQTEGRTVLLVSHNLDLVGALCTRALVLSEGRITFSGRARDAVQFYASQGARPGEIVKIASPRLEWRGLANAEALRGLSSDDDLDLHLCFRSGDADLERLHVDCELVNERGEVVSHSKSHFVTKGLNIERRSDVLLRYQLLSPKLAPGEYWLTVFVHDESTDLVWVEGVTACTITARAYFGRTEVFDKLVGAIVPEFSIEIESQRPIPAMDPVPVAGAEDPARD